MTVVWMRVVAGEGHMNESNLTLHRQGPRGIVRGFLSLWGSSPSFWLRCPSEWYSTPNLQTDNQLSQQYTLKIGMKVKVAQWTPWTAACQASLSITNSQSLFKLMSFKVVMPSSHLSLCRPLLLLPSIFPSIRVFSSEPVLGIRWPKYWSFSFSISLPTSIQGWFGLGLTGLVSLQSKELSRVFSKHHSSKASILWCSALFMIQFSHPYMTTGTTVALTRRTFVGKVMSLLFNMLSRFVITFLPRSKHLLILWLQSPSAVILEPPQNKICFHCFPIYLPWSDRTGCHDLNFLNIEF